MLLKKLRLALPQESIFHNPLVFELTLVLLLKAILLVLLWQFAFKPTLPNDQPDVAQQMGISTHRLHASATTLCEGKDVADD